MFGDRFISIFPCVFLYENRKLLYNINNDITLKKKISTFEIKLTKLVAYSYEIAISPASII